MATNRQRVRNYAKSAYPVGSVIWDSTCSEPYQINKRSVFEIFFWGAEDYNPDFLPDDTDDYYIEILVRNPGKDTRMHSLETTFFKYIKLYEQR
jgi:hypothetical protein